MKEVFFQILDMSISASYLVLAVVLLRMLLKKAPKFIHCILWAMVALRLICPDLPESKASLIPSSQPVSSAMSAVRENPTASDAEQMVLPPAEIPQTAVPQQTEPETVQWEEILTMVWLTGVAAMACYGVASYLLLRKKVAPAVSEDGVWLCDEVTSPFILGIFRPRIYLPSGLDEDCRVSVLAHEKAHLRRKDHWWKPLGFVLLTVHWFNPAMWVAYILVCRDIEAACDERVIKQMDEQARKRYSEALLQCAAPRHSIAACPLAFGEQGVKGRIKSVLSYKKPTIWIILAAILLCAVLAVCFLTDPTNIEDDTPGHDATTNTEGNTPEYEIMTAKIATSLPSCPAFEEGCFYVYSADNRLYRVYWTDMDGLSEGQSVSITFHSKTEQEYPNGYPDGGFTPRYEVTASKVEPETEPTIEQPPAKPPEDVDDAYLCEIADAAVMKKYGLTDLDDYIITVSRHATNGTAYVRYKLRILGHHTYESYTVSITPEGSIKSITGDYGKYARYLPYATDAAYAQAKEKLDQQLEPFGTHSGYYLSIDQEGYLCLKAEVIRYFETPVTGPDGMTVGGCGFDHEHLFFAERICHY